MHHVLGPTVRDFLATLATVPWFSNIGRPLSADAGVKRLSAWEDWPGPEEPGIRELSFRHQALYDHIMTEAEDQKATLTDLWETIHAAVFRQAPIHIPFDANQDCWHAPTMAVWQAAWTAGLIGLCLQTGRHIPPEVQEQWTWFTRGHWPCGYASLGPNAQPGALLVY